MGTAKRFIFLSLSLISIDVFAWDPVKDVTGKSLHEHAKDVGKSLPNCGGDICNAAEKAKKANK